MLSRPAKGQAMGTATDDLRMIAWLYDKGHLKKPIKVACLGAQQLHHGTPSEIVDIGNTFGVDLRARADVLAKYNAFTGDILKALGCHYVAFDIVEAPDVQQLDLNAQEIEDAYPAFVNAFDLVLNFGTTEHVMNQYNAMKVMHDLCRVGGYIYSYFIRGGYMDHGLVHYSDRFVDLWMQANRYEQIWRSDQRHECTWVIVRRTSPDPFRAIMDVQEGEGFLPVREVLV
jgi:hypothetical protein